ncbi:hypothetical protein KIN20_013209 [Parelaphostrongylus tenuis]|uniref:Secreted protein n=1 Tax=Parelaphostrongylus tenuis TaxID=148309 RepID=A0AAD5QMG3_PARTN|nr:hypothetical protein KIN20_013209 [Parelaphostrongylus tenuis]
MTGVSACPIMILVLTITAVFGCGVIPTGQGSTRKFNVTMFSLPVPMAFSTAPDAPTKAPGISPSGDAAKALVTRLVMQAVTDVLDQQGRAALLPDVLISMILDQLNIQVNYEPLECKVVFAPKMPADMIMMNDIMPQTCVVIGNTVTSMCNEDKQQNCQLSIAKSLVPIPPKHFAISGSITSRNIIMANWSRDVWQNVVNRTLRMLASDPFGTHFFSAIATVS